VKTIILTAGKIDYTRLPFGTHQSNATIPVNGKPVISWILDDLIQKGMTDITIVVREENTKLHQLLEKHYGQRIHIQLKKVTNPSSILHSLLNGLENLTESQKVQVILGDTLILDSFKDMADSVFVAPVLNSLNWCVVHTNQQNEITAYSDKKQLDGKEHLALCGYYCFSDSNILKQAVNKSIVDEAKELSAALIYYGKEKQLKTVNVQTWFDFGHLESLVKSKKSLLRPRHFNALTIDPILNTITKVSDKSDKLADELNWYLLLPEELKILTPRILSTKDDDKQIIITQEYYGYPALSELYIYGDLGVSVWQSIIDYLLQVHNLFIQYKTILEPASLQDVYITKTQNRITQLLSQSKYWEELWQYPSIQINKKEYLNIPALLTKLEPQIQELTRQKTGAIIHGDYCLSNILYDLNNQIVRLIDPRGSFGSKGIYGDPRYDLAKLRHSISGLYDYIVGDLFTIKEKQGVFTYSLFEDEKNQYLSAYLDQALKQKDYQINEIELIEGLLFLSMIPYHADHFRRQQMMYVRSIEILNKLV